MYFIVNVPFVKYFSDPVREQPAIAAASDWSTLGQSLEALKRHMLLCLWSVPSHLKCLLYTLFLLRLKNHKHSQIKKKYTGIDELLVLFLYTCLVCKKMTMTYIKDVLRPGAGLQQLVRTSNVHLDTHCSLCPVSLTMLYYVT